jgi:hypothetical protein
MAAGAPIICTSITDAEFINLTPAAKAAEGVIGLLQEMGYNGLDLRPFQMFNNNENAIAYANGQSYSGSSQTIQIKHHYINKQVKNGAITVEYVPTGDMA